MVEKTETKQNNKKIDNIDDYLGVVDEYFLVKRKLGEGYTSLVYLVKMKDNEDEFALKIFKNILKPEDLIKNFDQEVDAMKGISHKNLINIVACNKDGKFVSRKKETEKITYLALELAENCELFDYLGFTGKGFGEEFSLILFQQLIYGLKSMHDKNIAHRDLKTENIFLDKEFNLKIGDFGFSKLLDYTNNNRGITRSDLGTKGYQSPQLLEGNGYDGKANDIFACGVILFILTTGRPPIDQALYNSRHYKPFYVNKPEYFWENTKKFTSSLSNNFKNLVTRMLARENRITIDEIIAHEWFNSKTTLSKDDYVKEFNDRKIVVDLERKILLEKTQNPDVENEQKLYRSNEAHSEYKSILEKLEEYNYENFPITEIKTNNTIKYPIIMEGIELKEYYKYLIQKLADNNAKIEVSESSFSIDAEMVYENELDLCHAETTDTLNDDEYVEKIKFRANFYVNLEKENTVIEFMNYDSNAFVFKDFVDGLRDKLV